MKKHKYLINILYFLGFLLASSSISAEAVDGFPEGCSYASIREPLAGHSLRLGQVQSSMNGRFFSFSEPDNPSLLRLLALADNLGRIGQDYNDNFDASFAALTPEGFFVVAQVLDRQEEGLSPIVTCLSRPFPLELRDGRVIYGPAYYQEFERFKFFRFEGKRLERWRNWQRFRNERRENWRRDRRDRRDEREIHERRPGRAKSWEGAVIKDKDKKIIAPLIIDIGGKLPKVLPMPDAPEKSAGSGKKDDKSAQAIGSASKASEEKRKTRENAPKSSCLKIKTASGMKELCPEPKDPRKS